MLSDFKSVGVWGMGCISWFLTLLAEPFFLLANADLWSFWGNGIAWRFSEVTLAVGILFYSQGTYFLMLLEKAALWNWHQINKSIFWRMVFWMYFHRKPAAFIWSKLQNWDLCGVVDRCIHKEAVRRWYEHRAFSNAVPYLEARSICCWIAKYSALYRSWSLSISSRSSGSISMQVFSMSVNRETLCSISQITPASFENLSASCNAKGLTPT